MRATTYKGSFVMAKMKFGRLVGTAAPARRSTGRTEILMGFDLITDVRTADLRKLKFGGLVGDTILNKTRRGSDRNPEGGQYNRRLPNGW